MNRVAIICIRNERGNGNDDNDNNTKNDDVHIHSDLVYGIVCT